MISTILSLTNEILTAAIVVLSISILLYNLSRNLTNRVARTSGALLACVMFAYTVDVFTSLRPLPPSFAVAIRLQWLALAFVPSTLFHLSDALLETTGLPSRGRRKAGTRILYAISLLFFVLAFFTDDVLIRIVYLPSGMVGQAPAPVFWVYVAFFLSATGLAFFNVNRARRRCLTRDTQRRMAYLQVAMLTPSLGLFPFSVLLPAGEAFNIPALILVNFTNTVVLLMLVFLSYPLSFFGSSIPDRIVKSELLSFFLHGPSTGLLALATLLLTNQATRILGISAERFTPFAVVAVVLMWQWLIALLLPQIERWLIYAPDERDHLTQLRDLSARLLSRSDLLQLMDALLQTVSNDIRVTSALVAVPNGTALEVIASTHNATLPPTALLGQKPTGDARWLEANGHWWLGLYSHRIVNGGGAQTQIGLLGIAVRGDDEPPISEEEVDRLKHFTHRFEQMLDDLSRQEEIYNALEGLIPQMSMTRSRAAEVEYLPSRAVQAQPMIIPTLPDDEQLIEQVHAALRHYWGGPGLTSSRLLELRIVRETTEEAGNAPQALRNTLQQAIERQRPQGERKINDLEWMLYNILEMRFVQGTRVSDVARKLAMSQADLFRKQKIAIEAVAQTIISMEREAYEITR
jgi:hypothetical protein